MIPSQAPAVAATADIFWAAGISGSWFPQDSKSKRSFKSSYSWWMVLYTSLNVKLLLSTEICLLAAWRMESWEVEMGELRVCILRAAPQGGRKAEDELSWVNCWALAAGWSSRDCSPHYLLPLPGTRTQICLLAHLPIPPDSCKFSPWVLQKSQKLNI